jgi:hypothetical protein
LSQHAPGPWKVKPYVDAIDILDTNGVPVAHLADRAIADYVGMPPENARLIAAAPDMLSALLYIVRWKPSGWSAEAAQEMARSAIARATGQEVAR